MLRHLIAPIAALMIMPAWARADGCNPRHQDCGSYKDDYRPAARRAPAYSYAYTVRPSRGNWACPPELSRRECRRIQAEVEARRRGAVRRTAYSAAPRALRNVDPGPERIARRGRSRCAPYVKKDGPARPLAALAIGAARREWRREVRTLYGERYIDERFSPDFRISRPRIVGDRGINVRATARGTPCAGDD